tara:strand:+ start:22406 stop:22609 length:204 start_codon:yes stop_codon:yes gene_type:complete
MAKTFTITIVQDAQGCRLDTSPSTMSVGAVHKVMRDLTDQISDRILEDADNEDKYDIFRLCFKDIIK